MLGILCVFSRFLKQNICWPSNTKKHVLPSFFKKKEVCVHDILCYLINLEHGQLIDIYEFEIFVLRYL